MPTLDQREDQDLTEFRLVGLTSPEMRYFLWRNYRKMIRSLNSFIRTHLFILMCILICTSGCGKAGTDSEHADNGDHGPTHDPSVFIIMDDQMEAQFFPEYLLWLNKFKLPLVEQVREWKEIRIISKDLDKYSVNESDIYLDPYNKEDDSLFPMVQVALPRPIIEKTPGQIRLSIPGEAIESKLGLLFKFSRSKDYHHIRLRILMTDNTRPGNPIEMIFISTLWETAS